MNNKLLGIGSVVLLKNIQVMIIGYLGQQANKDETYDYIGVLYPLGFAPSKLIFFNKEEIEKIIFIGYLTPEPQTTRKQMFNVRKSIKEETYQ